IYVIQYGKGAALLTGDMGCGKSLLSRVLISHLDAAHYDIGLVINPSVPADELLYDIALQLGITLPTTQRSVLFRTLDEHLVANAQAERSAVLIVDEAQTIQDKVVFDDLRMLLNFQLNERYLLTLILLGQPGLQELMSQQRGLDQRLAMRLHLDHLSATETASYIAFRLQAAGSTKRIFTDTAIQAIHQESQGIPRRINNLSDLCLFEGMRAQVQEVESALVKVIMAFT